jgi:hypothetical protein
MTKNRLTNRKRSKKSPSTSPNRQEVASQAVNVIAKWWKRLKHGGKCPPRVATTAANVIAKWWKRLKQGEPLLVPSGPMVFTTPSTSTHSDVPINSSTSRPFFAEDWEKVVAAAELAESMMSPPKIALFEGDWEEVVAAAELAESLFLSKLK